MLFSWFSVWFYCSIRFIIWLQITNSLYTFIFIWCVLTKNQIFGFVLCDHIHTRNAHIQLSGFSDQNKQIKCWFFFYIAIVFSKSSKNSTLNTQIENNCSFLVRCPKPGGQIVILLSSFQVPRYDWNKLLAWTLQIWNVYGMNSTIQRHWKSTPEIAATGLSRKRRTNNSVSISRKRMKTTGKPLESRHVTVS